jgi:hypothetical protein
MRVLWHRIAVATGGQTSVRELSRVGPGTLRNSPTVSGSVNSPSSVHREGQAIRQHIEGGAKPNERERSGGSSPLITAATFGQTEVAKALIEAGADVDQSRSSKPCSMPVPTGAYGTTPDLLR